MSSENTHHQHQICKNSRFVPEVIDTFILNYLPISSAMVPSSFTISTTEPTLAKQIFTNTKHWYLSSQQSASFLHQPFPAPDYRTVRSSPFFGPLNLQLYLRLGHEARITNVRALSFVTAHCVSFASLWAPPVSEVSLKTVRAFFCPGSRTMMRNNVLSRVPDRKVDQPLPRKEGCRVLTIL